MLSSFRTCRTDRQTELLSISRVSVLRRDKKTARTVNRSAALRADLFTVHKFHLLKLKQNRHFQILGFMHKFAHGLLPSGFKDYFCTLCDIHAYNTRTASRLALCISFARTNRRKKSLKITVSYLWTDLPLNIRQSPPLASFK